MTASTESSVARTSNLALSDFIRNYAIENQPVVITDAIGTWPALTKWSLEYFKERYGDVTVPVWDLSKPGSQPDRIKLALYIDYLERRSRSEDPRLLYVKDWNYFRECPELQSDYHVPAYFNNDWLTYLARGVALDLRWIFIGPRDSFSGLHCDIYETSAWLAMIDGRKHFRLYPPDQSGLVYGGKPDAFSPDFAKFPLFKEARGIDAIIGPGELIYVPTGWWHAVRNLDDTIALTMNFVDCENFLKVRRHFKSPLDALHRLHKTNLSSAIVSASDVIVADSDAELCHRADLLLQRHHRVCTSLIEEYREEARRLAEHLGDIEIAQRKLLSAPFSQFYPQFFQDAGNTMA